MKYLKPVAVAAALALAVLVGLAQAVGAHTGFESSTPADGATVEGPLDSVTLVFSAEAAPAGEGFEVLDSSGAVRVPVDQASVDGRTWVLHFEPPLAAGEVAVRWKVKAPDKHPIEGGFSFTVSPAAVAVPPAASSDPVADEGATREPAAAAMADFLAPASAPAGATALVILGRFLALGGLVVGLGGLVFAALVMRGSSSEVRRVLYWVRRSGLVVAGGAFLEFAGEVLIEAGRWPGSFGSLWSVAFSTTGTATALRVAGGLLLTSGTRIELLEAVEAPGPVAAARELVGAGVRPAGYRGKTGRPGRSEPEVAWPENLSWHASANSVGAALGGASLLASMLFDGHTVSKGDRLVTGLVDLVHVAGGAVWAGGLVCLAGVLWRRHHVGGDLRAPELAARFSVVAAGALVLVGAAGVGLAIIILDSPSELWSTPWGRLLIAKSLLVVAAAAAGAYNHTVLIPEMEARPQSVDSVLRFRSVVFVEAAILAAAVLATAFLVGAAS